MRSTLAVCYRAEFLALVILGNGKLYDWRRHRLPKGSRARMGPLIADFAADYQLTAVVTDPNHRIRLPTDLTPIHLSLRDAKQILLPGVTKPTHRDVIQHLARHRSIRPLVTVAPVTGNVSMTKPWQTVMLLASALALAHQAQTGEQRQPTQPLFN